MKTKPRINCSTASTTQASGDTNRRRDSALAMVKTELIDETPKYPMAAVCLWWVCVNARSCGVLQRLVNSDFAGGQFDEDFLQCLAFGTQLVESPAARSGGFGN